MEESEMSVLDHIFFTIGNGYKWKDGVPFVPSGCDSLPSFPEKDKMKEYEKNLNYIFSNIDDIWYFYVDDLSKEDRLKWLPHLKDMADFCSPNCNVLYVKTGNPVIDEWNSYIKTKKSMTCAGGCFESLKENLSFIESYPNIFYPLSEYSKVVEMVDGEVEIGTKNIARKVEFTEECREYALKILRYAKEFYENKAIRKNLKYVNPKNELYEITRLIKALESR